MLIGVHITPEAKDESVNKINDVRYLISVTESAEGNKANKRMVKILNELFPAKHIRIVSGHHSPSKIISEKHLVVRNS